MAVGGVGGAFVVDADWVLRTAREQDEAYEVASGLGKALEGALTPYILAWTKVEPPPCGECSWHLGHVELDTAVVVLESCCGIEQLDDGHEDGETRVAIHDLLKVEVET